MRVISDSYSSGQSGRSHQAVGHGFVEDAFVHLSAHCLDIEEVPTQELVFTHDPVQVAHEEPVIVEHFEAIADGGNDRRQRDALIEQLRVVPPSGLQESLVQRFDNLLLALEVVAEIPVAHVGRRRDSPHGDFCNAFAIEALEGGIQNPVFGRGAHGHTFYHGYWNPPDSTASPLGLSLWYTWPNMKRRQMFQFTDQRWFPPLLSQLVHEFLVWFVGRVHAARPFVPFLMEALDGAAERRILDITTGAGSGVETLLPELPERVEAVSFQYPDVPADRPGLYTLVNGLHRLPPPEATELFRRLGSSGQPLLIVEGNNDNWWQAVGMLVFAPISAVLSAPFVRPFRFTRLLFTYLIPVLPLLIGFDGAAALFKLYSPADLDALVKRADVPGFVWRTGKAPNGRGGKIIYAIAYPSDQRDRCVP